MSPETGIPILSVITINYNNKEGLQKTIESVSSQSYKNLEYIVIDGGSTDGSKQVIEENAAVINNWVSEKDSGIYNAMNKGIAKSKGTYLLFLNSGDYLVNSKVLERVFTEGNNEDILYGNLQSESSLLTYPQKLNFSFFFRDSIGHVGTFIKRSLFDTVGLYNEEHKLVSDWEFFLKAIVLQKASYKKLDITISFFNSDGASNNIENYNIHMKERGDVLEPLIKEYYPELLHEINTLHSQLYLYNNSRAVKLVKGIFNSQVLKLIKR